MPEEATWPRRDVELSRRQRVNQTAINSLPLQKILTDSTARPWLAAPSYSGESIYLGNDGQNAGAICGYADHPHNQANAALIYLAVNAFEPMMDTLRRLRTNLQSLSTSEDDVFASMIRRIERTLKEAEGTAVGDRDTHPASKA